MRTETEILDLILSLARADDNVRAVLMNGSRVNPNAKKDLFQDFDIVYFVEDVAPYKADKSFPRRFGELMILQTPEDMNDPPAENDGHYSFLMQFMDGPRIDLSLCPLEQINERISDSLSIVLLDKDNLIPPLPPPSERDYLPQRPTAKQFDDCCNEFWWVSAYVAKGLWRDELIYAKYMLDVIVREQHLKMLIWYFGIQTDFQKSPGKLGKNLKQTLAPELWAQLEATYADAESAHIWDSLFTMTSLFRDLGRAVADRFNFHYPEQDDKNVTEYLHRIRRLPKDARKIPPR